MVVANRPDIVLVDKQENMAVAVEVTISSVSNIRKKEPETPEKYQELKEELERMWGVKATVVSLVIGPVPRFWINF